VPLEPSSPAPARSIGLAEIDLIAQWNPEGTPTRIRPGSRPVELDPDRCTWVQTHLPEVDSGGRRATRTDWEKVSNQLRQYGLASPSPAQQSALGSPLSGKPGVLTALGAAVITVRDNRIGSRDVVRLTRISLVQVTPHLLISARHRDGFAWVDPVESDQMRELRDLATSQRDPFRPTGLLASVVTNDRVGMSTRSDELAIEVIRAVGQAYPRAVLDRFSDRLSRVEQALADSGDFADPDRTSDQEALSSLLYLIAAVGRLERDVNVVLDDFERRTKGRSWENVQVAPVETTMHRTLDALGRIRGDARTTVDMIGSTRASTHLRIAEEQRKAESGRREREARLGRTIALLTSALLIPTLVASVFGANVRLPREGTVWETWLMFAFMLGLGSLSFGLLRELDRARDVSPAMRVTPYLLGAAALAAAAVIATGQLGTS
jgi:hypothetical protein